MPDKILILGGLSEFVPLVERAATRGLLPLVVDGNPEAPAKTRAKELGGDAFTIPLTEPANIAALMREQNCHAITSAYSDLLLAGMVNIADTFQNPLSLCPITKEMLPYYRDKSAMKAAFRKLDIPAPKAISLTGDAAAVPAPLPFPLIVKPADAYGSRGVFIVRNEEALSTCLPQAAAFSSDGTVLLEEYNTEHEFNAQCYVHRGEVHVLGIANREKTSNGDTPIPLSTRNIYPAKEVQQVLPFVKETLTKYISLTGQTEGPICMQFFYGPKKGFQVCEVCARFLGYEHELLNFANGISIEDLLLAAACFPEEIDTLLAKANPYGNQHAAVLYFHGRDGVVTDDTAAQEIVSRYDLPFAQFFYAPGERIGHPQARPYVLRYYLVKDSRNTLDDITKKIYAEVSVKGLNGEELLYPSQIEE